MNKNIFIFDIDKTLWDFTAELNTNLNEKKLKKKNTYDTLEIFQMLKNNEKIIALASKCWYPDISKKYLKFFNFDKYIDNYQLFPTGPDKEYPYKLIERHDKQYHIYNILNKYNFNIEDCVFFDDNQDIIKNLNKTIPKLTCIYITKGISINDVIPYL